MVIAIIGILAGLSVAGWRAMSQTLEFGGYTADLAVSLQTSTARANTTNQLYLFVFDADGFQWGPAAASLTKSICETATSAPAPSSTTTRPKPSGISGPAGWLCLAPTGIVSRLNSLSTCTYGTGSNAVASVPCLTFTQGTRNRSVLVSASGQAVVQ